jgi:hypothetical protein
MEFEIGDGARRRAYRLAVHALDQRQKGSRRRKRAQDMRPFLGDRRVVNRDQSRIVRAALARQFEEVFRGYFSTRRGELIQGRVKLHRQVSLDLI